MKISVEMTGDFYENKDLVQHAMNGHLYYAMMNDAKNEIRKRIIQDDDDITHEEELFLEELLEILTVDEI